MTAAAMGVLWFLVGTVWAFILVKWVAKDCECHNCGAPITKTEYEKWKRIAGPIK